MTKQELRTYFLAKRLLMSDEEYTQNNANLTEALFNKIIELKADKVLLFYPIVSKKEFDCRPLAQLLWEKNIKTFLPIADFKTKQMQFASFSSATVLETKKYDITEPRNPELLTAFANAIVIVPLLAHDTQNYRVGYGGGFYDRFFANHPSIFKLGVSFFPAISKIDDMDAFDVRLDEVVNLHDEKNKIKSKQELTNIIFTTLQKDMHQRTFFDENITEYEFNEVKFQTSILDTIEILNVKLKRKGKVSNLLINQLARHRSNLGEKFYNAEIKKNIIEYYNSSEILNKIEHLEQNNLEIDFFKSRKSPLFGLAKAHHNPFGSNGFSLIKNTLDFWFTKTGCIKDSLTFNQIIDNNIQHGIGAIIRSLHHHATLIKSKKNNLKGEWIIYCVLENTKYYLCLASHKEGDENIFKEKIEPSLIEFPELRTLLNTK